MNFLVVIIPCLVGIITLRSKVTGLGIFFLSMLLHGILYRYLGAVAAHIPSYIGICVVVSLIVTGRLMLPSKASFFLLLLTVTWMSISSMFGLNQETSAISLSLYVKAFMLALLMESAVKEESEFRSLCIYILVGIAVGAFYNGVQHVTGSYELQNMDMQRAAGLRRDPNDTAMLLIAGVPLCMHWVLHSKSNITKWTNVACLLLILTGIIFTKSRGGFVALVVTMFVLYIRSFSAKTTLWALIIMVFFASAGAYLNYWKRVETLGTGNEQGGSLGNRFELVQKGLIVIFHNPLLGVGPGNYKRASLGSGTGFQEETTGVAHNMYVEFGAENGLIGLGLLLGLIYLAIRGLGHLPANSFKQGVSIRPYLMISLIAMLTGLLFLSQGKNSVLWFIIGLGWAGNRMREELDIGQSPVAMEPHGMPAEGYSHRGESSMESQREALV
ncbi:MAG: O-antigen ligase family protein [Syntrophobacteraceae bacterium]